MHRIIILSFFFFCLIVLDFTSDAKADALFVSSGKAVEIRFPNMGPVKISPIERVAKTNNQCGVVVSHDFKDKQQLVTMGYGETEAESCGELIAIGRVPAPKGLHRVALLYRNYTRYAGGGESYVSPVVIFTTDKTQLWQIDEVLSAKLREYPDVGTIAKIRSRLESEK